MSAYETAFLPASYPHEAVNSIILKNGAPVLIRPIRPDDAPRLQEGFLRLSSDSIYMRFLEAFRQLTDSQAHQYASVDYHNRMALVAQVMENGTPHLVASARYGLVGTGDPGAAEAAIVVIDEYQRLGLGKQMMRLLINYARQHGVTTFLATVHLSNYRILNFIDRSGYFNQKFMLEPGVWQIRISIN